MSTLALDRLIAYHESVCERYDQALARLDELWDRIEAAMREHGSEVMGGLRGTDAAPLLDDFAEAFAESNRYRREMEAVGAYAEPLLREAGS
jgi:gamma-glutamyl:cysteine ligase YbdK (ATP-grasp superfamily)